MVDSLRSAQHYVTLLEFDPFPVVGTSFSLVGTSFSVVSASVFLSFGKPLNPKTNNSFCLF